MSLKIKQNKIKKKTFSSDVTTIKMKKSHALFIYYYMAKISGSYS